MSITEQVNKGKGRGKEKGEEEERREDRNGQRRREQKMLSGGISMRCYRNEYQEVRR